MQALIDWLSNKNRKYVDGVELYEKLGKNQHLLRFFRAGENRSTQETLYEELKKMAKMLGLTVPLTSVVKVYKSETKALPLEKELQEFSFTEAKTSNANSNSNEIVDYVPEDLEELTKAHAYLFRQKELLRKSLYDYPHNNQKETIAQRKIVMDEIVRLKSEIADIAVKRKFYEKYGYLPEDAPPASMDDLLKQRNNARSNISRQKSLLKSAKSLADRQKAEKRLAHYEKVLQEFETKILNFG